MKCPHCLESFHDSAKNIPLGTDVDWQWFYCLETCPTCKKFIIFLGHYPLRGGNSRKLLVYPRAISRAPLSPDVPEDFAGDYKEACLVFGDSAKASAALSRRCLQNIIREKAGITRPNLSQEIDELIKSKQLPSYLAESVDAVRNIGNFAAHSIKSTNTGEVVDVEPGEAEWLLDVLEGMFDFYFVQPSILKRKRDELDKKLAEVGKPPMK